ncbi:TonB-dependent receptor [Hymenobacter sp. BT770]|uniref:TonB-dependent receptor n=1 Tax=Hymenobacter sp. BT770 TaxID=2886942 RepID=UPI001D10107B|nr:TonB-dependent receptor [Hymenobacter sp. BT770]MCC3153394.1 TonB-dependent receptor [Hymenobacter sp. BT770]MDO3415524.1 TonB-dependent receptor [Hymenobacter sp. BT770]
MLPSFTRFPLFVALAVSPLLLAAQQIPPATAARGRTAAPPFTGRVVDAASGEGLPGANVIFEDLKQGTATGADGSFSFNNLPRGRFTVQIRSLGYNTVTQTVDTGSGQPLEVKLVVAATEIGQVVVTGVSQATELRRSPVPTSVVDRTRLNQTSAGNIVDAIAHTPGVSQITTGAAISKPVVRGLGYNRVITLNNGAKQEGQQWGDEHGVEIDEFSIERAEIIKGPGSLLYGSDAMAGVINFVAPDPVEEGRITGVATANYQANNHQQGYSFQNAGNLNGFNWLVRGTHKVAGDYRNRYDGRVYNSGFGENDANGYVGLNKVWGYSHLTFSTFNQRLGLTEGTRNANGRFVKDVPAGHDRAGADSTTAVPVTDADLHGYGLAVPRQQVNHLRVGLDNNIIMGDKGGRLTLQVSYQQNLRREFGNVYDPAETSLYFQLRTVDYSLRYFLPELNGWHLTVGTSGLHQQNRNLGLEFLIPAYRTNEGGAFAVAKKTIGALDISGGLRYDVRRITADALYLDANERPTSGSTYGAQTKFLGFVSTFSNYSGSLGAAYSVNERLTAKGNLSRGFRAPNIAELGSNGKHEGTIRYEVGNDRLQAETSLQVDAGLSYVTDHVRFSVDAFENSIDNYIFTRRLLTAAGADSLNNGDGVYRYEQGRARLYGGEVSLDFHPHPLDWLHFENSFSMVRAEQLNRPESERYLPFIPADRLQSELRANFRRQGKRITNPYARVQLEHTFAQNRFFSAFDTETATPGYTLINAGLGTDLANAQGKTLFSLFITANNLFDVGYQSHLSRLKYADYNYANGRRGVFNQGRNVSVRLVVPLAFK